jgi:hypothetical protein
MVRLEPMPDIVQLVTLSEELKVYESFLIQEETPVSLQMGLIPVA